MIVVGPMMIKNMMNQRKKNVNDLLMSFMYSGLMLVKRNLNNLCVIVYFCYYLFVLTNNQ